MKMNEKKILGYTVAPSTAYLMSAISVVLIINLGLFLLVYFLIYPIILDSSDPSKWSKIIWAIFAGISFLFFTIVYIIINSHRYWIDNDFFEILNVYRTKKKKSFLWTNISYIKIRNFPIVSRAFNFGTILFYGEVKNGKEKIIARFLGVKMPQEIYLQIMDKVQKESKEKILKELLS
ncbi:MAG: hypothetical protein ACFFDW_05575 [Candidatus Thorarchaeota archaeon]